MHYSSSIRAHSMSRRTISSDAALLKQHGFKIVSTDVGGAHHRKIYLELWNGDVWVQRGRPTPLISREAGGMVAKRIMSSSSSRRRSHTRMTVSRILGVRGGRCA